MYSWECNGDVIEIGLGLCLCRWGKARKREEEEKALEKGQEELNKSIISFQHHCLHSMAFNGCFFAIVVLGYNLVNINFQFSLHFFIFAIIGVAFIGVA